jgi:hypothetical protein
MRSFKFRDVAAWLIFAVLFFPVSANAQDTCGTADSIKQEAAANGFEVTLFDGLVFDQWLEQVIANAGPPPSGLVPDRAFVISGPNPLVVIVYFFTGDRTCDFVVARGPTALYVKRLIAGDDI